MDINLILQREIHRQQAVKRVDVRSDVSELRAMIAPNRNTGLQPWQKDAILSLMAERWKER